MNDLKVITTIFILACATMISAGCKGKVVAQKAQPDSILFRHTKLEINLNKLPRVKFTTTTDSSIMREYMKFPLLNRAQMVKWFRTMDGSPFLRLVKVTKLKGKHYMLTVMGLWGMHIDDILRFYLITVDSTGSFMNGLMIHNNYRPGPYEDEKRNAVVGYINIYSKIHDDSVYLYKKYNLQKSFIDTTSWIETTLEKYKIFSNGSIKRVASPKKIYDSRKDAKI